MNAPDPLSGLHPWLQAGVIVGAAVIAAVIADLLVRTLLRGVTRRTSSTLDDRILTLLRDPSHLGVPKPTCIIFSGGGYQAFWQLKIPQMLDGTPEAYEDAKRKLQFDLYYLKHMSFELDIMILFRTLGTFLRGAC